ncbi:head-tail connector protein [Ostreiculturibacter nitratireducens]|uniref:head-tail connector protein n=1 Tax=Ostreiculturibacter nitratireducens TaxID=3075226 RepID=UPI0031B629DD
MMLIEQTTVPATALPVQEFKDHLRLGTGFADLGAQDAALESYLRAAIAAIEGRIGKALISRDYLWTVTHWRGDDEQALPVAPVAAILSLTVLDRDNIGAAIDPTRYRLVQDTHRPKLVAAGSSLPAIPTGGLAEIVFIAGFGPGWADVPVDLRQAVLLLAAQYYEMRHESAGAEAIPFGVMALIERWRTVRVLGGGAA